MNGVTGCWLTISGMSERRLNGKGKGEETKGRGSAV